MVVPFPPTFDELGNRKGPVPPERAPAMVAVTQGPMACRCAMGRKSLWCLARQQDYNGGRFINTICMARTKRAPPFGYIKIRMPGTPDVSGEQNPKENQIPFVNMKIHMRPHWVTHHNRLKIMSRQTPMGQKFYLMDDNWEQHEYEARQFRAAIKARMRERIIEMIAAEVVKTRRQPQPTKDLFV
jgi:hypothetical protein